MNGKHTKWLSLLLCLVMILNLLPVTTFAETEEELVTIILPLGTLTEVEEIDVSLPPLDEDAAPVTVFVEEPTVPYYGRSALAALDNATALLYAYDQLAAGIAVSADTITVYNGTNPISQGEMEMVMDVYIRDHAHHFWLGNSYRMTLNSTTILRVSPSYIITGAELETAKTVFEEKVSALLSGITPDMSEYDKALHLHDALAKIITYQTSNNAHNAYGALIEGKAVCEGYAEALQYLLQRSGIQSFLAIGASVNPATNSTEGHEWNYVKIDGKFYHVDLTWNDQEEKLFHAYFNQTDAVIQEDHLITATKYALPSCTATDAQYFTGKDTYLSAYNAGTLGQLLKDNGMSLHVYVPGSISDFISWYQNNIREIAKKAGISGGFSYSYSRLGKELILSLNVSCSHTQLTLQAATEATASAPGHKAYYKCTCGKFFEDASATNPITDFIAWKNGAGKLTYTALTSGTCGEALTWSFEDGTLTISGTGAITSTPWSGHAAGIQAVILDAGITAVPENAFAGCNNLKTVYYGGSQAAAQAIGATELPGLATATWHYQTVFAGDNLKTVLQKAQTGTRIIMTADLSLSSITVRSEITLDLNGHTLTASYFTCYGNVTDGETGGNGLISANKGIHITGAKTYLPIYDTAAGGYRFYQYTLVTLGYKPVTGLPNSCKLGLRLILANPAGYQVLAETTDAAMDTIVHLSWNTMSSGVSHVFNDNTMRKYATRVAADLAANGTTNTAITLTITGLGILGTSPLTTYPTIETAPGVIAQGNAATWTAF